MVIDSCLSVLDFWCSAVDLCTFIGDYVVLSAMPPSCAPHRSSSATPSPASSVAPRAPMHLTSNVWSCSQLEAGQKALHEMKLQPGCHDERASMRELQQRRLQAGCSYPLTSACTGNIYIYIYMYIHACIHMHARVHKYACIYIYICYIYMYKLICIHIYIYVHICICVYVSI